MPELLRKIEVYNGSTDTRLVIKLMAMTFVRISALIGARWEKFDLDGGHTGPVTARPCLSHHLAQL